MHYKALTGFCFLIPMICQAADTSLSSAEITKWQTILFAPNLEIQTPDSSFRFSKSPHENAFQTLTENEKTIGVSQDYRNDFCLARISYFNPHLGRLSNTKIKRYLKEKTFFQITHQDSADINENRYHYTIGSYPDQTDILLAGQMKNNILQIRMSCQTSPAFSQKENRQLTMVWAKAIVSQILTQLKVQ